MLKLKDKSTFDSAFVDIFFLHQNGSGISFG